MSFQKLTRFLDSLDETYGLPSIDCQITHGNEIVYRHSAGYADAAKTRPVTPDTLYYLYSATKVITVTAAMQLIQAGRLHLEDRLDQYLPEFSNPLYAPDFVIGAQPVCWPTRKDRLLPAQNPIRILDLFRMTAGLSYDTMSEEIQTLCRQTGGQATTREMMSAIAQMPLLYEPGTRWVYSLSHDVLAAVVEVIAGQSFDDYLRQNIFDPLGIQDMHFSLNEAQSARLCTQYMADPETHAIQPVRSVNHYRLSDAYQSGGAGLIATVDAYSRFVQAMSNEGVGVTGQRILTRASIDELRQNRLNAQMLQDFTGIHKVGYGYGLGVRTLLEGSTSKSPVGEFGWDGAAGSYTLIDVENHLSIFVAEHVLSFPQSYDEIHPVIRDLAYEIVLG